MGTNIVYLKQDAVGGEGLEGVVGVGGNYRFGSSVTAIVGQHL